MYCTCRLTAPTHRNSQHLCSSLMQWSRVLRRLSLSCSWTNRLENREYILSTSNCSVSRWACENMYIHTSPITTVRVHVYTLQLGRKQESYWNTKQMSACLTQHTRSSQWFWAVQMPDWIQRRRRAPLAYGQWRRSSALGQGMQWDSSLRSGRERNILL